MTHCESCGANTYLTKSHFLKRNSIANSKRDQYDYKSDKNYFFQCLPCHMSFEQLNKHDRVKALSKISKVYSRRAKWLLTN